MFALSLFSFYTFVSLAVPQLLFPFTLFCFYPLHIFFLHFLNFLPFTLLTSNSPPTVIHHFLLHFCFYPLHIFLLHFLNFLPFTLFWFLTVPQPLSITSFYTFRNHVINYSPIIISCHLELPPKSLWPDTFSSPPTWVSVFY